MAAKSRGRINGLSSLGLQRRLLEVAVVVGADEDTGLIQRSLEPDLLVGKDNMLFKMHFQAHLLDILSGTQEHKAEENIIKDASKTWRKPAWKSEKKNKSNSKHPKSLERNRSIRMLRKRANKEESVSVSSEFLNNLPYICLPDDSKVYGENQTPQTHFAVLTDVNGTRHYASILKLYHPMYASKENRNKSLLWKLSKGYPSNSSCQDSTEAVLCYVPICICLVSGAPYFNVMKTALSCLCNEWKDAISYELFHKTLKRYVTNLSLVACPSPHLHVHFTLCNLPLMLRSSNEVHLPHLVGDIDLALPILVFMYDKEILLQVLACILLEQRIVFLSESYSLITLVVEALLTLIRPFVWPHQYVPLLFSEIIDFVACPGIFLMGCHVMHMAQISQVQNDQILVDLDTGQAFSCPAFDDDDALGRPLKPLSENLDCRLPPRLASRVSKRLSALRLLDSSKLNEPFALTITSLRKQETEAREKKNLIIKAIFLEMMVDLFSTTINFLDHEISQFRSDEFLKTIDEQDLFFYTKVVKTYMFKKFIEDRLGRTADAFSKMAQERQKTSGDVLGRRTLGKVRAASDMIYPVPSVASHRRYWSEPSSGAKPPRKNTRSSGSGSDSDCFDAFNEKDTDHLLLIYYTMGRDEGFYPAFSVEVGSKAELMTFEDLAINSNQCLSIFLPAFPPKDANVDSASFYRRSADIISDVMREIPSHGDESMKQYNHTTRASCLLLRGLYLLASGNLVQGLEDLHEIAKQDFRIFPRSIMQTVMSALSTTEVQLVRSQACYKGDGFYSTFDAAMITESPYYSDEDLPYLPLDRKTFSKFIEKSDVTSVHEVINWLFDALSNQSHPVTSQEEMTVDPEAFAAFYHTWKQRRYECETALRCILSMNINIGLLMDSERILKVSELVSSTRGSGRLILTTERILFMTELYEECKLVVRLTQLTDVKLTRVKTLFRNNTALVLKQDEGVSFRVSLKSKSELWKYLIEEMKTGRMLSTDWKDPNTSLDTAAHNVAVADALYQAVTDEDMIIVVNIMTWVKKLCHFTELHASGQLPILPRETDEMLVLRIGLAPKETKKSEVNAILYSTTDEDAPRVWVALSSSKIRFIDATKWELDPHPIIDCHSNLTCMCSVGKELWVGASDNVIYVVDCDSLKKTQVMHDPSSPVLSVFSCDNKVVGVTSSGEVILWNKATKTKISTFTILHNELPPHNELLSATALCTESIICCCSQLSLSLYTLDGARKQLMTLKEFFPTRMVESQITCCLCAGDQIWAGDSHGSLYQWLREETKDMRFVPKWTGVLYDIGSEVAVTCIMLSRQRKNSIFQIWVGNSVGNITILNSDTYCQERTLKAHDDFVTSLCLVENRYVISGSRSSDGRIAAWRSAQL